MKIKELVPILNEDTFAEDYFRACGVDDIKEFVSPSGKCVQGVGVYQDIELKAGKFCKWASEADSIVIVQDPDTDGICSATLTYKMLLNLSVQPEQISFLYHPDKKHGLSPEIMEQIDQNPDINMVIIPDAGSNDIKHITKLCKRGVAVVVLDHHDVSDKNAKNLQTLSNLYKFIIVNNQLEAQANKHLCGTGVVFKFWQTVGGLIHNYDYANHLDLVALANIADVMDMRELENVAINKWGLSTGVKNKFLQALCDKYCKSCYNITPSNVSWDVAPKLNSVCRSNDQEAKKLVLEAFCGIETNYAKVIKAIEANYSRQQKQVKVMRDEIIAQDNGVKSTEKVVVRFCDKTPYTGLIANKLMSHYNKPILLVHNDGEECSGSCRSPVSIRKEIDKAHGVIYAEGHDCAFGVAFKTDELEQLNHDLANLDLETEPEQVVASTLNPSRIPTWLFYVSGRYERLWGEGVKAPRFYIPRVRIEGSDIRELGAGGTTLKFVYKGVEYIKFFATKNDKEQLQIGLKTPLTIDLLGSLEVNKFNGREIPQVKIDKFEIVERDWCDLW